MRQYLYMVGGLAALIGCIWAIFAICDDTASKYASIPIPTQEEMEYAVKALTDVRGKSLCRSVKRSVARSVSSSAHLDYSVTYDYWFAAVISCRNNRVGEIGYYMGLLNQGQLFFRRLRDDGIITDSDEMIEYLRLLRYDSLWVLLGDFAVSKDRSDWLEAWKNVQDRDGDGWVNTASIGLDQYRREKQAEQDSAASVSE